VNFRLLIEKRAIKEIQTFPTDIRERITKKIKLILTSEPLPGGRGDIKKIEKSDFLRLRIGQYRVFFSVDMQSKTVYILSVLHRSKAYREF